MVLVAASSGCSGRSNRLPTDDLKASTGLPGSITRADVLDMTLPSTHFCAYAIDPFPDPPTLKAGRLRGPGGDVGGFVNVVDVQFGDVNQDGVGDGIANMECNWGAVGEASMIITLTGGTRHAAEVPYQTDPPGDLGGGPDPFRVSKMVVKGDSLILTTHSKTDTEPVCCPSIVSTMIYRFSPAGPTFFEASLECSPGFQAAGADCP